MQITRIIKLTAFSCAAAAILSGCGQNSAETERRLSELEARVKFLERKDPEFAHAKQVETIAERFPDARKTDSGLHYVVVEEGEGEKPSKGDTVVAEYTGTLLNGTQFDSSVGRGPFSFPVGMGRVIAGWDEAFLDMKKGEKRKLIIPSKLAYGERATGPIPPNSVLVFDVELLDIK